MRYWTDSGYERRKSHDIVSGALEICVNLDHRGGCGCDPITGDGAGIFIQTPDKFFRKIIKKTNSIDLPSEGNYGVGFFYLSKNNAHYEKELAVIGEVNELSLNRSAFVMCRLKVQYLEKLLLHVNQKCSNSLMNTPENCGKGLPFERKLYLARRIISFRLG